VHRRPLGSGRTLAALGALAVLVASVLPWYTAGGDPAGLPVIACNAFSGLCGNSGAIVVFVVALAVLALVALPYAAGDKPVALDRPLSFGLLAVLGLLAFGYAVLSFATQAELAGLRPDRAPGTWLAGIGLIIIARAAWTIGREPARR
jgi:hypothetical protein